ncbi:unnamed protein product [Malus baccata var. baccata]
MMKLIRSLHIYGLDERKRNEVERELVFKENESYVELPTEPLLLLIKFPASQVLQGHVKEEDNEDHNILDPNRGDQLLINVLITKSSNLISIPCQLYHGLDKI